MQCLARAKLADTTASAGASESKKQGVQRASKAPLMLVVEPTRELAEQVADEIEKFKTHLVAPELRHSLFIGGQ